MLFCALGGTGVLVVSSGIRSGCQGPPGFQGWTSLGLAQLVKTPRSKKTP